MIFLAGRGPSEAGTEEGEEEESQQTAKKGGTAFIEAIGQGRKRLT